MKIFFDTEFIEDGKTIELLSIGAIGENGTVFYAENAEADHSKASEWVRANVLPHLLGDVARHPRKFIADAFRHFCGEHPEFWAYYADYDWVALCQLYGRMVDLPNGWPMYCRDVKQLCMDRGNPTLPPKEGTEHHALQDARWAKEAWEALQTVRPEADAKDAARYRWLRGRAWPFTFKGDTPESADAAIDEAMENDPDALNK